MAFLLRVVSKAKWISPEWIGQGDVPADALSDLRTTSNALSVWRIEPDRSNLTPVLVAAASNRPRLDKLDYTLIDEQTLLAAGIECTVSEGNTPCPAANSMHRDLAELTGRKLLRLTEAMINFERVRVPENRVRVMLQEALSRGDLDLQRVPDGLIGEIDPGPPQSH